MAFRMSQISPFHNPPRRFRRMAEAVMLTYFNRENARRLAIFAVGDG
jgi:hypothetical protein